MEFNGGPTKLSLLDKKEHFSGPPPTKSPLLNKKAEFSEGGPTKSPLLVVGMRIQTVSYCTNPMIFQHVSTNGHKNHSATPVRALFLGL